MKHKYYVAMIFTVVVLIGVSTLALYYRTRAIHLRRELDDALAQVEKKAVEPAQTVQVAFPTKSNQKSSTDVSEKKSKEPTEAAAPAPVTSAVNTSPSDRPPESDWRRRRGREWIEILRTNDPARYAEIQQLRQEMRNNASNAWIQTTDYFMNRDTSNMSDQDMEEYGRMMTLLDQTRGLMLQMQTTDVPREERREVMSSVRSNMVELAPLLDKERDRELYDMSLATGQNAADASSLVVYVNQIVSNTSVRTIFPFMRGPWGVHSFDGPPPSTQPAQ